MDIYLCSCCGGLLIFRAEGKNKHHPFHLDTGWPCWRLQKAGLCSPPEALPFPVSSTADSEREEHLKAGQKLYRRYERTKKMKETLDFVAAELKAGRSDVVQDLLEYLFTEARDHPVRRSLIRQIIASDPWRDLVQALRSQSSPPAPSPGIRRRETSR